MYAMRIDKPPHLKARSQLMKSMPSNRVEGAQMLTASSKVASNRKFKNMIIISVVVCFKHHSNTLFEGHEEKATLP